MAGHDRFDPRSRRSVWTTWVPLAVTVTAAAVGVAAWILTRDDDHEDSQRSSDAGSAEHLVREQPANDSGDSSDAENAHDRSRSMPGSSYHANAQPAGAAVNAANDSGEWGSRVSNIGHTASGAMLDAGRKVSAGVAAAGAAMGSALAAITEEERSPAPVGREPLSGSDDDVDRNRNGPGGPTRDSTSIPNSAPAVAPVTGAGRRRRTVAVVVSGEGHGSGGADDRFLENGSLLSHIPRNIDLSTTKLFVLVYAPGSHQSGETDPTSNPPPHSLDSSYSNIGHDQLETPSEDLKSPFYSQSPSSAYQAVESQALALVEHKSMVFYFNTPKGYTYMLRHLEPELDVIYLQESLAGDNGAWVTSLQLWFRRDIILVVGADAGDGGLADDDDESDQEDNKDVWWKKPERVGRGRGVVVVDSSRMTDDWVRRVQGVE